MITWLTPTGEYYTAIGPASSLDVGVPDYPDSTQAYTFNRETWQWDLVPPTVAEQIQTIQNEYMPQLSLLQRALNGAVMYDDEQDIADIKEEYKALVAEMDARRAEVQNGS